MQAAYLLQLQRVRGNQAVTRMIEAARAPSHPAIQRETPAQSRATERAGLADTRLEESRENTERVLALECQQVSHQQRSTGPVVQRSLLGDLWAGAQRLGSRALGGLQQLGSSALATLSRLGSGALNLLQQMGEAALEWGPRIVAIITNPVGALVGGLWLALPDRFKAPLINTILGFADAILSRIRGILSAVMGPLWPLIREFMLGFIRRMREVADETKVSMSNRLARLMTGGSLTFMLHFAKGLALGLWDIIRSPYDLIVGIIAGIRLIVRIIRNLTVEDLEAGLNLVANGLSAAWSGLREMVRNPQQAIRFVETIWESISRAVGQMGRALAQGLLDLFQLPDAQLGERAGRLAGNVAGDAILAAFTAGAGALLRRAAGAAAQVARLLRTISRVASQVMRIVRQVVEPLMEGLSRVAQLFRRGAFGNWLERLQAWLRRLLTAVGEAMRGGGRAIAGRARRAVETVERVVARFVERARAMARQVFEGLGFRSFEVEAHGEYLHLYGIRSKILLARFRRGSLRLFQQDRRLAAELRQARQRLLRQARRAEEAGDVARASRLRGRAVRLSEEIGERAAEAAFLRRFPNARRVFAGRGAGTLDRVYRLPDGTFAILEAKGGAARLGTRAVRGREAQQGTVTYLRSLLGQMSGRSGREGRVARKLLEALDAGQVRYFYGRTPIRGGQPLETRLREFLIR